MNPPSPALRIDPGPSAQRERRDRILDAAAALGRQGDFEAVQMRVVAEQADVALGTLYRYFPSKVHLLRAVLVAELEKVLAGLEQAGLPGRTPAARVMDLTDRSIHAHQADPRLHAAMIRSYVFARESASVENIEVSQLIRTIICRAMRAGGPVSPEDLDVAGVIADVWLSATVGWVAGRISPDEVRGKMVRTAQLLLGD